VKMLGFSSDLSPKQTKRNWSVEGLQRTTDIATRDTVTKSEDGGITTVSPTKWKVHSADSLSSAAAASPKPWSPSTKSWQVSSNNRSFKMKSSGPPQKSRKNWNVVHNVSLGQKYTLVSRTDQTQEHDRWADRTGQAELRLILVFGSLLNRSAQEELLEYIVKEVCLWYSAVQQSEGFDSHGALRTSG
jgi:hypothetical protein